MTMEKVFSLILSIKILLIKEYQLIDFFIVSFFAIVAIVILIFIIFKITNVRNIGDKLTIVFLACIQLVVCVSVFAPTYTNTINTNVQLVNFYFKSISSYNLMDTYNAIINMMMFFPLGVLWCILLKGANRWIKSIAIIFATTIVIELVQLAIPYRITDINDIVYNGVGGAIGASVAMSLIYVFNDKTATTNPTAQISKQTK